MAWVIWGLGFSLRVLKEGLGFRDLRLKPWALSMGP